MRDILLEGEMVVQDEAGRSDFKKLAVGTIPIQAVI